MAKELSEYTVEELRSELLRRRKRPEKYIPQYEEFEGVVVSIYERPGGFYAHNYVVQNEHPLQSKLCRDGYTTFKLKQGCFKKANAPKVGDRVLLTYRKTQIRKKSGHEVFDFVRAKIIKVVK